MNAESLRGLVESLIPKWRKHYADHAQYGDYNESSVRGYKTCADELAAALSQAGVASEYYTVDEGSAGWTIFWPDRPGYFYGFGYSEEAEVRAKSVCRALNKERALWGAAPAVVVDEAARGVTVERREDMSQRGRLKLFAEEDGDMCLMVVEDDGTSAGIEFCASGGRSPRTLGAVRALSHAMAADNIERPLAAALKQGVDRG